VRVCRVRERSGGKFVVTSHGRGRDQSTTPQGVMMSAELDEQDINRGLRN